MDNLSAVGAVLSYPSFFAPFCALAPNPRRLRLRGFVGRRVVVTRLHREVPGAGSWLCVLVVLRARRFDRAITLFEFDGGIKL